jgi:rhodanese-related sulfurtransferase
MSRLFAAVVVAVALFWVSPAPADDPEVPEKYMSVDQANALLEQKKPVTFIDVRPKDQFDELHIRGARSIPLTELPRRLASVSKKDFLVLY